MKYTNYLQNLPFKIKFEQLKNRPDPLSTNNKIFTYADISGYSLENGVLLQKGECVVKIDFNKGLLQYFFHRKRYPFGKKFLRDILIPLGVIFLCGAKGYSYIHSAVLMKNKRILMFAGNSGSGKTTLSRILLKEGWCCLSDDSVLLKKDEKRFTLLPFKITLRIGKTQSFSYVKIDDGNKLFLLFPEITDGLSRIDNINSSDSMELLLRASVHLAVLKKLAKDHLKKLADLLSLANCYKIYLGRDMKNNPERLVELLQECIR